MTRSQESVAGTQYLSAQASVDPGGVSAAMALHDLATSIEGEVVTPADPGWDEARQPWDLVDQRPALVAMPVDADDVRAIVHSARQHGLRVAPQGTGHNAGPLGPLGDTILSSTSGMRGIEIDPAQKRARVEAGVLWSEVTRALF